MLFSEYDIRGIWQKEINKDFALKLGKVLVAFSRKKQPRILINFDTRFSSPILARYLIRGVSQVKGKAILGGKVSTPFHYFLTKKIKPDLSVMITASHNPPQWNGFKLFNKRGEVIYKENGLKKIQELLNSLKENHQSKKKKFSLEKINLKEWQRKYFQYLEKESPLKKDFWQKNKFVFDFSNGGSSLVIGKFLKKSKIKGFFFLNKKIDAFFRKHPSNPLLKESQKQIKRKILEEKAIAGAIFDGDGDRVVFFNQKGEIIPAIVIAKLLIENYFPRSKRIVSDVLSGLSFKNFLQGKKIKIIYSKVGTPYIYFSLKKKKTKFGFESSGHFYYASFWNYDNADLTLLKILNLISSQPKKWQENCLLQRNFLPREEINFDREKYRNYQKIKERIKKRFSREKGKFDCLDGLSFFAENYWFNLRKSKTTPILRLNVEANSEKELKKIKKELISLIER